LPPLLNPWCDTSRQSAQLWKSQSPECRTRYLNWEITAILVRPCVQNHHKIWRATACGYVTFRYGHFGLSRFGLSRFGWPIRSGRFGLAVSVWAVSVTGHFSLAISVWGHFGHDISAHKQLTSFVYWNDYIGRWNVTLAACYTNSLLRSHDCDEMWIVLKSLKYLCLIAKCR